MIAQQPPLTQEQADHADALYRARWQSLLSVDDLIEGGAGDTGREDCHALSEAILGAHRRRLTWTFETMQRL